MMSQNRNASVRDIRHDHVQRHASRQNRRRRSPRRWGAPPIYITPAAISIHRSVAGVQMRLALRSAVSAECRSLSCPPPGAAIFTASPCSTAIRNWRSHWRNRSTKPTSRRNGAHGRNSFNAGLTPGLTGDFDIIDRRIGRRPRQESTAPQAGLAAQAAPSNMSARRKPATKGRVLQVFRDERETICTIKPAWPYLRYLTR